MLAAVDVDYRDPRAVAACVLFREWTSSEPAEEHLAHLDEVHAYVPGKLYLRELPCLLAVLARASVRPDVVLVDGYVSLGAGAPGLGAHLFDALEGRAAIVGVAKTRYASATDAVELTRGASATPLFISAMGMDVRDAAEHVRSMHGAFRIPTLIKRADMLCRNTP